MSSWQHSQWVISCHTRPWLLTHRPYAEQADVSNRLDQIPRITHGTNFGSCPYLSLFIGDLQLAWYSHDTDHSTLYYCLRKVRLFVFSGLLHGLFLTVFCLNMRLYANEKLWFPIVMMVTEMFFFPLHLQWNHMFVFAETFMRVFILIEIFLEGKTNFQTKCIVFKRLAFVLYTDTVYLSFSAEKKPKTSPKPHRKEREGSEEGQR